MNQKKEKINFGRTLLSWRAPEFRHYERGAAWVFVASFLALALIGFSIWQNSYAPVVAMLLIAGIYFLTHNKKPREIETTITTNGFHIDKIFIPFSNVEAFWIFFDPAENLATLHLILRKGVVRERAIELGDADPDEIRAALSERVFELSDRTETLVEKIIRLLKL